MGDNMSKFQLRCCCVKCKQETTTCQLSRNHKDDCPIKLNVKFPFNIGRPAWNKGLTKETDSRVLNNSLAQYNIVKNISPENEKIRREKLSLIAKANKYGGYRENAGRSKKFKVIDSFGNLTTIQSTYELRCSIILNELNIKWIRPKALRYDGVKRYFPDFYLVDYDIYLDPKNDYLITLDKEKIEKVISQNNVRVVVIPNKSITQEYITSII